MQRSTPVLVTVLVLSAIAGCQQSAEPVGFGDMSLETTLLHRDSTGYEVHRLEGDETHVLVRYFAVLVLEPPEAAGRLETVPVALVSYSDDWKVRVIAVDEIVESNSDHSYGDEFPPMDRFLRSGPPPGTCWPCCDNQSPCECGMLCFKTCWTPSG